MWKALLTVNEQKERKIPDNGLILKSVGGLNFIEVGDGKKFCVDTFSQPLS